ncbi:MAG: hypothetical protein OXH85_00885 [Truepera sp.]|nr:hypothetical protein [Truepera sp.]
MRPNPLMEIVAPLWLRDATGFADATPSRWYDAWARNVLAVYAIRFQYLAGSAALVGDS